MKIGLYLVALRLFLGCSPAVGQTADSVVVLPVKISAPANQHALGHIKAGNNSTELRCDYEAVVNEAKRKASAMGGNLVKITELISPVFIGSCYRISADVYKVPDISNFRSPADNAPVLMKDTAKYATLYIYRLKDTLFPSASYPVYMDSNTAIFQSKSKNAEVLQLHKEQKITIWAKAGKRKEITIDVQYGRSYYLRCGVEHGSVLQNPVLELIPDAKGEEEYRTLDKGKHREKNPTYLNEVH